MKMPKDTTLNQVPALFKKVDVQGKSVIDYGCGKYDKGQQFLLEQGARKYQGYDKFWNDVSLDISDVDMILCANVLNVVHDYNDRLAIYVDTLTLGVPVYFSVYEGDKSGVKTSSQNNLKTQEYVDEIVQLFDNVKVVRKSNVIEVRV